MDSYSNIDLDSDSGEIHPNIDERSYRNWRTRQREQRRRALEQRLEEICKVENPTGELLEEKVRIEEALKPQYRCVETESFRTPHRDKDRDYIHELEFLVEHNDLGSFIELMDRTEIEMEEFENLVLYNLTEQIKEGNDAGGVILSKLSLYVKYALSHGRDFLQRLNAQLTNRENRTRFEEECRTCFEETKKSFLEFLG